MKKLIQLQSEPIRYMLGISLKSLLFLLIATPSFCQEFSPRLIRLSKDTTGTVISNHDANLVSLLHYDWLQCNAKRDSLYSMNAYLNQEVGKWRIVGAKYDSLDRNCYNQVFELNSKWRDAEIKKDRAIYVKNTVIKWLIVSAGLNGLFLIGIFAK